MLVDLVLVGGELLALGEELGLQGEDVLVGGGYASSGLMGCLLL